MTKQYFTTLDDAKEAYPEYVLFDGENNQYYKPFNGSEPWDCACVAIWQLPDGRIAAEEY
jgi:hypothetical protein